MWVRNSAVLRQSQTGRCLLVIFLLSTISIANAQLEVPATEDAPIVAASERDQPEEVAEKPPIGFEALQRKLVCVLRELKRLGEWDDATYDSLLEVAQGLATEQLRKSPAVDRWGNPVEPRVGPVFDHLEWKKKYEEVLSESQRNHLLEILRQRLEEQRQGLVTYMMAVLDTRLLLTEAQRGPVRTLVEECAAAHGNSTQELLVAIAERKHELSEVLSALQLKSLQAPPVDRSNPWRRGAAVAQVLGKEGMGFIAGVSDALPAPTEGPPQPEAAEEGIPAAPTIPALPLIPPVQVPDVQDEAEPEVDPKEVPKNAQKPRIGFLDSRRFA